MDFLATSSEISKNEAIVRLYNHLKSITKNRPGNGYYKYPVAGGSDTHLPDIVLVDFLLGVCVFDVFEHSLDLLRSIDDDRWNISGTTYDSPILKLEDYQVSLLNKYQKYRQLPTK